MKAAAARPRRPDAERDRTPRALDWPRLIGSVALILLFAAYLCAAPGCIAAAPFYAVDAARQPFRAHPNPPIFTVSSWNADTGDGYPTFDAAATLPRWPNLLLAPWNFAAAPTFNLLPVVQVLEVALAGDVDSSSADRDSFVHVQAGTWYGVCGGMTLLALDLGHAAQRGVE